jgi:hypothetical protein
MNVPKIFFLIGYLTFFTTGIAVSQVVTFLKSDSSIVRIKSYYKVHGKIFLYEKNYRISISENNIKSSFKPSSQDLLLTEQLMDENYNRVMKNDPKVKFFRVVNYKQHFFNYYRQYVAFITRNNDKIITIFLFTCCKRNIRKCFPNWENDILPLTEGQCSIQTWFEVNLTQHCVISP